MNIKISTCISIIVFLFVPVNNFAQLVKVNENYYLKKAKFKTESSLGTNFNKSSSIFSTLDNNAELDTIVSDFTINSHDGEADADQESPAIAIDSVGNYAVTWKDQRDGFTNIYARFYKYVDYALSEDILVSDGPVDWNSDPAIACNSDGDFIISWASDSYSIFAQRFTKTGAKIDSNFQVADGYYLSEPSISVFDDGSFVLCYTNRAYSGGTKNLYIKTFDENNNSVIGESKVNDIDGRGGTSHGWGNRIATDRDGNMIVVWSDNIYSYDQIFLQRMNNHGSKIGKNILVSDTLNIETNIYPTVASTNDGHFIISWESYDSINYRIFHFQNSFITDHIKVEYDGWRSSWVSSDTRNTFLLSWVDTDPKVLKIATDGTVVSGPEILMTAQNTLDVNNTPVISNLINNSFYAAYPKNDYNDANIYVQKYNKSIEYLWNSPKQIGKKEGSSFQEKPLVYYNKSGQSIVLWEDQRHGRYDLYAQVFDENYKPVGKNIRINDDLPEPTNGNRYAENPAVSSLSDGTFIVAFYTGSVYLQKVSANGERINNNVLVTNQHSQKLVMHVANMDRIILCWYRDGTVYRFYKQILNDALQVVSGPVTYEMENRLYPFSLSINDERNVFISFGFSNADDYQIYGLVFNTSGEVLIDTVYFNSDNNYIGNIMDSEIDNENNLIVTTSSSGRLNVFRKYYNYDDIFYNRLDAEYYPYNFANISKFKNKKAIITWSNYSTISSYFINDNNSNRNNFELYNYPINTTYKEFAHNSDIYEDKMFLVYESSENPGYGLDIFGTVKEFTEIDFEPEVYRKPVNNDVLYQNYPNPFNGKTVIPYKVFSYYKVKITLYNVIGREVKVLVNKYHDKGFYEIELDSSTLSSGLYFIRMEAFNTFTRKILVIK